MTTTTGCAPKLLKLAMWNMLADGLSYGEFSHLLFLVLFFTHMRIIQTITGEFMSDEGDSKVTVWGERGKKVKDCCSELMVERNSSVLVIQECDHFWDILHELRNRTNRNIQGVFCVEKANMDTADFKVEQFKIRSMYTSHTGTEPKGKLPKGDREKSQAWLAGQYAELAGDSSMPTFGDEHAPPA
jgi:hypothetical protein